MKNRKLQLSFAAILLVVAATWLFRHPASPLGAGATPSTGSTSTAQPRLPVVKLWLGTQELTAEVAHGPIEVTTGMMFRTNMAPNEAMIFLLAVRQQAAFYMRNTFIPLSCAYMDDEGIILELHDMKPLDETPILSRSANVRFVLEVNRGWFEKNHIGPGSLVRTERGSLSDLLRRAN
jgi:uncharacterized membrane protein (UPF0127 family)